MDLVTFRDRVREDLQDVDAANYRWTNAEVDGAVARAVHEFSLAYPEQQQDDIATTSASKELDISSLTDWFKILSIEHPIDKSPPYYQRFSIWAGRLYMQDKGDGNDARVHWGKHHTVYSTIWVVNTAYVLGDIVVPTSGNENGYSYLCTTAGTSHAATEPTWPTAIGGTVSDGTAVWTCQNGCTIPEELEEIVILGATGYLAVSASVYTVDRASIAGKWATINFLKWGKQRLELYKRQLKNISIDNKVVQTELYSD